MNLAQQIFISATKAALDESNLPTLATTSLAQQRKHLELFTSAGHAEEDYDAWLSIFTQAQGQLRSRAGQKAASENKPKAAIA